MLARRQPERGSDECNGDPGLHKRIVTRGVPMCEIGVGAMGGRGRTLELMRRPNGVVV